MGGLFLEAQAILDSDGDRDPYYARDEHLDQVEWGLRHRSPEAVHENLDDEVAGDHDEGPHDPRYDRLGEGPILGVPSQGARDVTLSSLDHRRENDPVVPAPQRWPLRRARR